MLAGSAVTQQRQKAVNSTSCNKGADATSILFCVYVLLIFFVVFCFE
jgi:hypothetical protein